MSSGASSPRSQPRQPPRLPERYELRRHIASGGMASVWCAEDRVLGRTVAIKILAERFAHDQLAVRRFKREARAAARVCGHHHVVTVFDVGDTEAAPAGPGEPPGAGRAFIVMEYLAGGTVADAIRVGAVRRHEAMRWLAEAASALDHAHGRGIVHRDIKPANFLLDRSRVLHVADFGIARLVFEDTISSADQLFGTAAYLAPEQALGRAATSASDRYALAVAAFELLVGERPFAAPHFAAQARQHVEDPPPRASERNRSLPEAIDPVLRRGMAKDPDDRFASAEELVTSLQRALSGVPSVTAPLGPGARGRRGPPAWTAAAAISPSPSARRRGGRAIALGALLVAILGVIAVGVAATGGGSAHHPAATNQARVRRTVTGKAARHRPAPRHRAAARTPAATHSTSQTTATPPPSSAAQLQATGHEEMLSGDYQTAISTLRQAVSSSDPGSLTYAYALYDLGRSLVLGGDPSAAIPVLEQRLKIPNQTPVVQQMLDQALQAAGRSTSQTSTTTTTSSARHTAPPHAGSNAASGGAGLAPARSHPRRRLVPNVAVSFAD
jgi:hypothetical protein